MSLVDDPGGRGMGVVMARVSSREIPLHVEIPSLHFERPRIRRALDDCLSHRLRGSPFAFADVSALEVHCEKVATMKVLLAIDGSEHSHAAVDQVASRDWPGGTEIQVLTVIHSRWPLVPDPSFVMAAAHMETVQERQHEAPALLDDAARRIRANASKPVVTTTVREGTPHQVIVQVAEDWGADLIVLGSHGYGRAARAVLGSVAAAVFSKASSAVEIVRLGRPLVSTRPGSRQD